jgi:hypothetical protein
MREFKLSHHEDVVEVIHGLRRAVREYRLDAKVDGISRVGAAGVNRKASNLERIANEIATQMAGANAG